MFTGSVYLSVHASIFAALEIIIYVFAVVSLDLKC